MKSNYILFIFIRRRSRFNRPNKTAGQNQQKKTKAYIKAKDKKIK